MMLHTLACAAAQKAVDQAIQRYGEDNKAFLYCGFAWATIKPARGAFVNSLKKHRIGSAGTYGGWTISSNAMFSVPPKLGQSMELKEIGVQAYIDTLRQYDVQANFGSRAD